MSDVGLRYELERAREAVDTAVAAMKRAADWPDTPSHIRYALAVRTPDAEDLARKLTNLIAHAKVAERKAG